MMMWKSSILRQESVWQRAKSKRGKERRTSVSQYLLCQG
jgi:hypothetical protein